MEKIHPKRPPARQANRAYNPIQVYRYGWYFLAGTSSLYLVIIAVRASLGMDIGKTQKIVHQKPVPSQEHIIHQPSKQVMALHAQQKIKALRTAHNQQIAPNPQIVNTSGKQAILAVSPRRTAKTPVKPVVQKAVMRKTLAKPQKAVQQAPSQAYTSAQQNYLINSGYTQSFMHDLPLQVQQGQKPAKKRTVIHRSSHFGVRLAKGKNLTDVRNYWTRMNRKYAKAFHNLGPLVIKENTGDPYPIKLIIGPFRTAEHAVKFCASMKQAFNCNLNKYQGTPL